VLEQYDATLAEATLLERIMALNADPAVHGILVQMPLPRHIDAQQVIAAIATHKDVDGFSVLSAGELMTGLPGLRPATPFGCMKMIESTGQAIRGKHAVVIGRSNTVGKPMALLLLQANATVTVCHSATPDLATHTRQADILVAAVGHRHTITADLVKPGAIVIDVGMNRNDAGKLCGDVDFEAVREALGPAGFITPVPGGVGPMTITMLLVNTLQAAEAHA
jgi:methylenetetrahydrofolate dehydrogenase (NADP+)/methenyltetrahydrofolate cyclohydrolase